MLKTRIALAIGATAITGAGIYAADQYFTSTPEGGAEPIQLAITDKLVAEAQATDCGLKNNVGAARD
ncbi:MAG: hypothetical protein AAGL68_11425, partial [Pseudomonadota bacterium]